MDNWATEAGFYTFSPEAQLSFLHEKEMDQKKESRKRKAEEEAQDGWVSKMRWKTINMAFPPKGTEIAVDRCEANLSTTSKLLPLRFNQRPLLLPGGESFVTEHLSHDILSRCFASVVLKFYSDLQ